MSRSDVSGAPLARKLGLRPGQAICLLDATPAAEAAIRAACDASIRIATALAGAPYDQIFFWPRDDLGLAERFAALQARIVPSGAVWAVIPRKPVAERLGLRITWESVQAAGLTTDLVDTKNAKITDEEYGTRFVIRLIARPSEG